MIYVACWGKITCIHVQTARTQNILCGQQLHMLVSVILQFLINSSMLWTVKKQKILYLKSYLTYITHSLGKFSRWQIDIFLFFPENRIWHFMQIVSPEDNLHEMSNLFSGKNKKNISKCRLPEFFKQNSNYIYLTMHSRKWPNFKNGGNVSMYLTFKVQSQISKIIFIFPRK